MTDLAGLRRAQHQTSLGPIVLWGPADARLAERPALITITGPFATIDTMSRLQAVLGEACECHLAHLPGNHCPPLREATVEAFARALDEVIETAFAGRAVVLHGISVGALVAVAARAPAVRAVVAVEPPLSTGKLWPLIPRLQRQLAEAPADRALAAFIEGVFGVTRRGAGGVGHHAVFEGGVRPVDVLAGEVPLLPERALERFPSFVDEADRAFLLRQPGVTLHVAPGAGHSVASQAPAMLTALLLRAVADAAAHPRLDFIQRRLLERTPASARRLRYRGPGALAFEAVCRARNPQAAFGEAAPEVLVVETLADVDADELSALPPGASLVAAIPPMGADAARRLLAQALGEAFEVLQLQPLRRTEAFFDDAATNLAGRWRAGAPFEAATRGLLLVARRRGEAARPATHLCLASYAPRLMDIRTTLPAQALRSEATLVVSHQRHDFRLPDTAPDAPRVLVLQRPALLEADAWRAGMANAIRKGWVVVLEFDDHPELAAQVAGQSAGEQDWRRFGYAHAVQTSTPELAAAFGAYNPEVRVFANAAFDLAPFPQEAPRRVFYGAVTRGPFAAETARALAPALAAHPDVECVVVGDEAVFAALPTAHKRFLPMLPYADYLAEMGRCAVSLSPVEPRAHIETKSDAKFVDAASRGVLTIGSPIVYGRTIRHGENGLLAADLQDWAPMLAQALADEPARRRMAEAAWGYVREARMFADQIAARRAWYEELWARRAELNAAVARRLPALAESL